MVATFSLISYRELNIVGGMSMLQTVTAATLVEQISAAKERIVFVAPGVADEISQALVSCTSKARCPLPWF